MGVRERRYCSFAWKRIGDFTDRFVVIKNTGGSLLELAKLSRGNRPDQRRHGADTEHRDDKPDVDESVGHGDCLLPT